MEEIEVEVAGVLEALRRRDALPLGQPAGATSASTSL